jgi:hypothetical protein
MFNHPKEVVGYPSLSIAEKRGHSGLSWASDASAIASCPALRAPKELKAAVTIDEILPALCELTLMILVIRRAASLIVFILRRALAARRR